MSLDFNDATQQRSGELIPDNEAVPVHLTLRPGGHGPEGWLKRNRDGNCLMMDCEFTVTEGPHARRKFWSFFTVEGETDGQMKAVDISRSRIRAMLESARGIDPTDESETAVNARRISSYADLDGLRFWAVVGIEKGDGQYKDKNILKAVMTPDRKGWSKLEQVKAAKSAASAQRPAASSAPAKATGGSRPSWAA